MGLLQVNLHQPRPETCLVQLLDDALFMLGAEGLDGNAQLHALIPVGTDELIVTSLTDIAVLVCDNLRDLDPSLRACPEAW